METSQNPTPETKDLTDEDLNRIMSQYTSPAKSIVEKPVEQNATIGASGNTPQASTVSPVQQAPQKPIDPDAPYGRYLKGKKKGQPRTAPYTPVKGGVPVQQTQTVQQPQQVKLSGGMLISAGLFLSLTNMLIPMAISLGNNYFEKDPKRHIDPKKLKLSGEQIRELDPVVDAVLKQVELKGNPTWILLLGLLAGYGMNFMMIKMTMDNK